MDCFLVLRGVKTLPLRMIRHSENAAAVVDFLAGHPRVECVLYPFHASNPQAGVARRQMRFGGGMVSFILKGGAAEARRVAEGTRVFALAESLGGVESLIEVPAVMTHASTANSPLAVEAGLVRLSVGIEAVEDLIEDLERALGRG
jgi:cystathionine gamma-synthase